MPPNQPILVAVAWPYASGPRHLGHVAGFGVPSDIYARYQRLRGNRVLMVSGTDEHGTPITVAADAGGVTPRALADRYNRLTAEDMRNLGLSYDLFTRTTTANHHRVVQDVFRTLHAKGYLLRRTTLGAFSAATGRTLPDRYVEGTCPICGYPSARGDQCDTCGNQLDPADLVAPRSRIDGQPPVFRDTEHFFLDLPVFADQLADWIGRQTHWRPNVRSFSLNLLDDLKPRPITRDLDWGVPIPLPDFESRDDKRIYVWFDAVIGYLSASVEWARMTGQQDARRDWWQNPDARHAYFMGKDNIVFHTVIWPSILLGIGNAGDTVGGGEPLRLPDDVVSSEFLTMEGRRFSASRGIGIEVRDFLDRYDPDPLRYYLAIAGPETADTDFTWAEFVRRNNDELIANWGNLVQRTLSLTHRHFGTAPEPGPLTDDDAALLAEVEASFEGVGGHLDAARFKAALIEVMRLSASVNRYLGEQEPWKAIGDDQARAATVLWVALQCVANLNILLSPFLPFSSQRLHERLGGQQVLAPMPALVDVAQADHHVHRVLTGDYTTIMRWEPIRVGIGRPLAAPESLFRKLDPAIIDAEVERMAATVSTARIPRG
jgi:methionyl-tRNA synthetase